MIKMHRRISGAVTVLTMTALILTGCTSEASSISSAKGKDDSAGVVDTGFTLSTVGSYDSADTAVVLATDEANKAVTLINMETGKQYTLYYDGTTYVKDKHDGPMTISQIEAGDVVDVTFLKGKKKLASIKLSPEAWVYDDVYNYDLAGVNGTASIGSQTYSLPEGAVVLSEGRRVDKAEVVSQDVVTFSGIGHKIYSVNVDKGHGYLRLKNDQPLLGGWVEVGNSVIRQITEDMLLVVPEGSYQVMLTNNNISCVKNIVVERDKEVVLDVSDVEIAEDATGKILFSVTPETAKVSVDGNPVDISKAVELPYGIHRVEATASGYDTLTKHIQVGSEYATISFTLEETRKEERDSVSENSVTRDPWEDTYKPAEVGSISDNTLSSISENALGTSNNNKVYIDSPKGVEVYLDGNYIGLSPVKFTKTAGRHEITLRKDGYESKTYTIYLENDKKDETYSFSALVKIGTTTSTDKTIPREVVNAASGIADCKIVSGTDVMIAVNPDDNTEIAATLKDAGIETIKTTVKTAVQMKIGEAETNKYTFTVAENLTSVTEPSDTENGKGTVSVTISRSGYVEQTVSFSVVIEKGETSVPKKEISVTVIPSTTEEVANGESVTFKAEVVVDGDKIDGAEVDWSKNSDDSEGHCEDNNEYVLEIGSEEKAESITVTATYTDTETEQVGSGKASVKVKQEDPVDPTPTDPKDPVDPTPTDPKDPVDPAPTDPKDPVDPAPTDPKDPVDPAPTDPKDPVDQNSTNSAISDDLSVQTFEMQQNAHPIRNFFSSLFKK